MNVFDLAGKLTLDASSYEKGLNNASQQTQSFGSKLSSAFGTFAKVGSIALTATSTAVSAFGKASVDAGSEFDKAMSQVVATKGYTLEELNEQGSEASQTLETLRNFAMKMGSETAFSATQAAEALNYMALAGYDTEKSLDMLPKVLDLAAAGGMELATASDMITDAQTALGLSMDETTTMVNQMAKAASKTNTSVSQLGDAILTIGGTAKNLSGGTLELTQVLGVMADNGIKASEAGTHLRNIMLALNPSTDDAVETFKALGIQAYDSEGNMRSMSDIFTEMSKSMAGMTDQEKQNAISSMFNKTDIAAVNALLSTSADRWEELSVAINDSEGSASAMAQVQLDNLAGDITIFQSALEGLKIIFSDKLTPSIREFVQFATKGISALTDAMKNGGIDEVVNTIGDYFEMGLSKLVAGLPKLVEVGEKILLALIKGIAKNIPALAKATLTIVGNLVTGLADGIKTGIPKLVAVLPTVIKGFVNGFLTYKKTISTSGITILKAVVEGITNALPSLNETGKTMLETIINTVTENLPRVIETAINIVTTLIDGIVEKLPQIVEMGLNLLTSLINGISENLPKVVETAKNIITKIVEVITENLPKLLEKGVEILKSIISGIVEVIPKLTENISNIVSTILKVITENLPTILDAGVEILKSIIDGIVETLPKLMEALPELITSIVNFITENLPTILDAGIDIIMSLIEGIINCLPTLIENLPQIIIAIVEGLAELHIQIFEAGIKLMTKLWDGIANKIPELKDSCIKFGEDMKEWFMTIPSKLRDVGQRLIEGLWDGIGDKVEWIKSKISGFADDVLSSIKDFFGIHSPSKKFAEIGKYMAEGLGVGWDDEIGDIKNDITDSLDFGDVTTNSIPINATNGNSEADTTSGYTQIVNINQQIATADELAQELRLSARYGLMGGVAIG